jgi:hypothetical protein
MIETTFFLRCDRCREPFDDHGEMQFDLALQTHGEVRKAAKDEGWRRLDGIDLCAGCIAAMKPEKTPKPMPVHDRSNGGETPQPDLFSAVHA